MTAENALELIKDDLSLVEEFLISNIGTGVPLINEVVTYLLSSGGKRLRPAFLILSARMCGYAGPKAVALSSVIEYIHTATLLHDDIVDGAKYRRNRPSVNSVYGNDIAVLCGDFLYSRGYIVLTEYGDGKIQKILSHTALLMSEGEVIQLLKTADVNITLEEYINVIRRKTAALFSSACEIGGRLAGMPEEKCLGLRDFGHYLGLSFQMSDDILDYFGNYSETGKETGADLAEGKLTLPVILLLKKASPIEKKRISEIFLEASRGSEDLKYIVSLMDKYSVAPEAEAIADEYVKKSLQSLDIFEKNKYYEAITALAAAVLGRNR